MGRISANSPIYLLRNGLFNREIGKSVNSRITIASLWCGLKSVDRSKVNDQVPTQALQRWLQNPDFDSHGPAAVVLHILPCSHIGAICALLYSAVEKLFSSPRMSELLDSTRYSPAQRRTWPFRDIFWFYVQHQYHRWSAATLRKWQRSSVIQRWDSAVC